MRTRAAILLGVVALAACKSKPKPAELQARLQLEDSAARANAAKALAAMYAADPVAVGDHGKAYWTDRLARGEIEGIEHLPRNEGPGDPNTEDVRLDAFWTAEIRPDAAKKSVGVKQIARDVKFFSVQPPRYFVGTWTSYYVNGAIWTAVEYSDAVQHTRSYYDDGKLKEESVYDRWKLVPIGRLTHWYPDGTKAYVQEYEGGHAHGVFRTWYPSGHIQYEWPYADGKREGKWKSFREDGSLDLCEEFRADVAIGRDCQ